MQSVWAALLATCLLPVAALAQPATSWASGQLQIQGSTVSIYSDPQTNDALQTVNVGEAIRVRTCFGGVCGAMTAGDPRISRLAVKGELRGPELPNPVSYTALPGGAFLLPGFQTEGDYVLENIRLVELSADGSVVRTLSAAEPSAAVFQVRQILLASATVSQLSLAELRARGIVLTQQNYQAFSFSVGFAFGSDIVQIEMPVLYQENGQVGAISRPEVRLDGLPENVAATVRRWEPPTIVPFALQVDEATRLSQGFEEEAGVIPPLFGAIVIPGNISFLNQFFDARLIVANGAPQGSSANLDAVTGSLRLPSGNVLRLGNTDPPVVAGQRVPVLKANGATVLGPGERGAASWTVEGLAVGTHVLTMDIAADLLRPGRESVPLRGSRQAAVEVVDARFNLTFNHPDVVREGEDYTLYVTVTNLSGRLQQDITISLDRANILGAHPFDASDPLTRNIPSLPAGGAETLEYRLVADVSGQVTASTFQSTSPSVQGAIRLRTGIGEKGIPLSPSTLVLPRHAYRLPKPLLTANIRLLGLAYSLAVAPAGASPADLPHVVRADVERRANDLAEAGQRLYLKDTLLASLEALLLDQLGNREPLAEYDTLRRLLDKGRLAGSALGEELRTLQAPAGANLGALDLLQHFASTMTYARPFFAASIVPTNGVAVPTLELRENAADGTRYTVYTTDEAPGPAGRLRQIPYSEIFSVNVAPGGGGRAPLAVVGSLLGPSSYVVALHAPTGSSAAGQLVLVVPDGPAFRLVDFGNVTIPAGGAYAVLAVPSAGMPPSYQLVHLATGNPVAGAPAAIVQTIARPPFRLIGAVQDFELDLHGLGVSYLFNRPPDVASAETAASYEVRSAFRGQDTSSPPQTHSRTLTKRGTAAFVQPSERVVNVRYDSAVSPLQGTFEGQPILAHEHRLATNALRDRFGASLDAAVPVVTVETDPVTHAGGLVDGKVTYGNGTPAANTEVQLIRWKRITSDDAVDSLNVRELVATYTTGADGIFAFDFIEEPLSERACRRRARATECVVSGFTLRALVPEGANPVEQPAQEEEVSSIIRLQSRLAHVNIALLGRGTVQGTLVYDDTGSPVGGGAVTVGSSLFGEGLDAVTAADGTFRIGGLPVGPLTVTGRDSAGNRAYATIAIAQPGQTRTITLRLPRSAAPRTGTVIVKVRKLADAVAGQPPPQPEIAIGAQVRLSTNGVLLEQKTVGASGEVRFTAVPEGQASVQAADFSLSRTPVQTDLALSADQTVTRTLTLSASLPRAVLGKVIFHDDLTNADLPVAGAQVFVPGPGVFAATDANGDYRLEGLAIQGPSDPPYQVSAIDFARSLQASVTLGRLDPGDEPVTAPTIRLARMTGTVEGVVLDPLGRPLANAGIVLYPIGERVTDANGRFSFANVPVGAYGLVAHVGDGLQAGLVGYLGRASVEVVFGGHRAYSTVRCVGAGTLQIRARAPASTGSQSLIYYRATRYSAATHDIDLAASPVEATTDADGRLTLLLPVGAYTLSAYNPFHGTKSVTGTITYSGQVINHELVFEEASTVRVHVVDVDGLTPVPGMDVTLSLPGRIPQRVRVDAQGTFVAELVSPGHVSAAAEGYVGPLLRFGRADGLVTGPGQTLDVTVRLSALGTVRGRVLERTAQGLRPLASGEVALFENAHPNRRFPAGGGFLPVNANGEYEFPRIAAGQVSLVARDRNQVSRQGRQTAEITADFQVVQVPDVVIETDVGQLVVTVRDADTGAGVPDCQITLSNGEVTVADGSGVVSFDALALGTYSIHAFHAPSGRAGRVDGLRILTAGQTVSGQILLDTRGRIGGTLWDDAARTVGVAGGTVQILGNVNGRSWGTSIRALATTASGATPGAFLFDGLPVGTYAVDATAPASPRRAATSVALTPTSPTAELALVLEPTASRSVRVFENRTAPPHLFELDTTSAIVSVRLSQPPGCPSPGYPCSFDVSLLGPTTPFPNHLFTFDGVLSSRPLRITVSEVGGEQRTATAQGAQLVGAGTAADPYRLVLTAEGAVRVTVRDGGGALVSGANVYVNAPGGPYGSATNAAGVATFTGIPAGTHTATAQTSSGLGGLTSFTLTYDDEVADVTVTLEAAVSAQGIVYAPPVGDVDDPGSRVPQAGAIVRITDAGSRTQVMSSRADGSYRFDALRIGTFSVAAELAAEDGSLAIASAEGTLSGPNGTLNALAPLVLDAAAPRIVSVSPPPGQTSVSRLAIVEILFSEALHPSVTAALPTFFRVLAPGGSQAPGAFVASLDATGRAVVRFTPSALYENRAVYAIVVVGGPGGVRDRAGRQLTSSGDVGSSFTTSDTVGPQIVATSPALDRPVSPQAELAFDFNEPVSGTAAELDGDGVNDAAVLEYGRADGGGGVLFTPIPSTMFLTRGGYTFVVRQPQGLSLAGDNGRRRITISRLRDSQGNAMQTDVRTFVHFDTNPPAVQLVNPPAAPDGLLAASTSYSLVPVLTQLDGATAMNPAGDADRVEYFLAAPGQPDQAAATPVAIARTWPFAYSFVAPYAGNGTDPWPYSVWAQAVDTSQNRSALVRLPLQVLPNRPPAIGAVGASAVAPVMGTFYAGSLVRATLTGLDDPDAAQLTVSVELRRENDSGPALDAPAARLISRPAGGWSQLSPPAFDLRIPVTLAEGTALLARARVVDPQGANVTKDSPVFAIADDATPPAVNGLVVRLSPAGTAVSQLTIGQRFTVEFRARDGETAVRTVSLAFSGTFATPVPATLVAGTPDVYRTAEIVVPVGIPPAGVDVTLTASAEDQGGNTQQTTALVRVAPTADPTAPQAQWLSPWEGALWPSGYTSVISPGAGTALLLRLRATDRDSVSGNDVPGTIVSVQVKGPADRLGTLSSTFTDATLFSGTGIGEGLYQAFWRVPNDVPEGTTLRFLARVTDTGGNATETYVQMSATRPRRVHEGTVTAVPDSDGLPAPAGAEDAPLFLLDGATVSLTPLATGVPRAFGSIVLLTGALEPLTPRPSILTAPEITSFASAVLFQPLDLTVTQLLGIGHGSRVDLSGRGLLGGLGAQFVALPGEVASGGRAGGSHGGLGGVTVSAGGGVPGGITDSVRDPALPGGGGGAGVLLAGGNGGGVVRIDGEGAVLALYGDLLADGQSRTEGGDGGGGAGGAIRLRVRRVEGRGTVSARGGNAVGAGGGGGGRVSLSTVEPTTGPLPISFSASGGRDGGSAGRDGGAGTVLVERRDAVSGLPVAPAALSLAALGGRAAELTPLPGMGSGAGTGFTPAAVSNVDLAGSSLRATGVGVRASLAGERVLVTDPAAPGGPVTWELPVSQQTFVTGTGAAGTATHSTRLSLSPSAATTTSLTAIRDALLAGRAVHAVGRSRFGTVEVASGARLVAEDDLEAGLVDPPALNSRASLSIDASSRALLRGEAPLIATTTAVPAPGSTIDANTTISLAYGVTDPLGLSLVETTWSLGTGTQTTVLDEALQLTNGPLSLVVPPTQPAGPVSYRVRAVDRAGRVADLTHTWTVRADTVPPALVSLDLVPSSVNDAYVSGDVVTITVRASDNVAVKRIRVTLDGQTRDFSSTVATFVFTAPPVAAQTPFVLSVELLDYAGNTTPVTRTLQVSPAGGPGAPVVRIDCPSSGALLPSGYAAFVIQATATDDVGVARVEFLREGETTPFSTKTPVSGNPPTFVATSDPIALPAVSQLTTVRFRVRAVDGTTASSERVVEIRVVPGTVDLLAAGPNDWSALASQVAVLRSGTLVLDQPRTFGGLIVLRGAQITHSPADAAGTQRLDVATPGDFYVECGAALDVTAKGWPAQTSQPGIAPATLGSGGSHIGRGGQDSGAPGATYGSVRRPDEHGGGAGNAGVRGGGRVRLRAGTLQLDGSLFANGAPGSNTGAGAGGSVFVTATNVFGNGPMQALGGDGIQSGGGGGAIAVEYSGSSAGLFSSLMAASGGRQQSTIRSRNGGAGSVLLLGPATPLGALSVANGTVPSSQGGDLPALGSGIAQPGSGGATLVTDRLNDVPAFLAGHHVEIRSPLGALEGLYTISTAAGGISGKTVLLEPLGGSPAASVDPGDLWQGVNAFDSVQISSSLASGDPVRTGTASLSGPIASGPDATTIPAAFTAAAATIEGRVSATVLAGGSLTVAGGGLLTHAPAASASSAGLELDLTGALTLQPGGNLDVSGAGLPWNVAPSGDALPSGAFIGGSHIGRGGTAASLAASGATFGSVERPREFGAGSGSSTGASVRGGGRVHVKAGSVVLGGAIRANGAPAQSSPRAGGGAGGSVFIEAGNIAGDAPIEAKGGPAVTLSGGGGGGAVTVRFTGTSSGTWRSLSSARGGQLSSAAALENAGAGSLLVVGPATPLGELRIDNSGTLPGQATELPALGNGTAQAGSSGALLKTGRATPVPQFFAGHFVEVSTGAMLKGTYRVAAVSGADLTLESASGPAPAVQPGDTFQGVYRVDAFALPGSESFSSPDPIRGAFYLTNATLTSPISAGLTANGTVELSSPAPAGGFPVTFTSNSPIAAPPPATVTIPAGATSAPFSVATTATGVTVNAVITAQAGGSSRNLPLAVVREVLSDLSFTTAPTVTGGSNRVLRATLSLAAGPGGAFIPVTSSSPAAPLAPGAGISVAPGATQGTLSVPTIPVDAVTLADLTGTYAGTTIQKPLTINPPLVNNLTLTPQRVSGNTSVTLAAFLNAAAGPAGADVVLTAANPAVAPLPATIRINPGATTASLTFTTGSVSSYTVVPVTATFNGNANRDLMVTPEVLVDVTVSASPIVGGNPVTGNVVLSQAASTGGTGVRVELLDAVGTVLRSTTVTVPAGSTSTPYSLLAPAVAAPMSASVKASYSGIEKSAAVTLNPASLLSLTTPATIGGGQTVTGTINLDGLPSAPIQVTLESSNPAVASVPAGPLSVSNRTLNFNIVTVAQGTAVDVVFTARAGAIETTSTSTITPPPVQSLALDRSRVSGNTVVTGTVTMASTIVGTPAVVTLSSLNPAATPPTTVTVPVGSISATFTFTTSTVAALTSGNIEARTGAVTRAAGLSVTPEALADFTLPFASVIAGAALNGTVTLTQAASAGGTTVNLSASPGGAVTIPGNRFFTPGVSSLPVPVTAAAVSTTTVVTIGAEYSGITKSRTLTIEPASLTGFTLPTVSSGRTATATFLLDGVAPAGATISLTSANPAVLPVPATLAINGLKTVTLGVTAGTVTQRTDVVVEATYRGVTLPVTVAVVPEALTSLSFNATSLLGGQEITGTLQLSAPASVDSVVSLSVNPASAAVFPATVTIPTGSTTRTFVGTAGQVSTSTAVNVTASLGGVTAAAAFTVNPNPISGLVANPSPVFGGDALTVRVILRAAAPAGGAAVTLTGETPEIGSGSFTIPAGQLFADFPLATTPVAALTPGRFRATLGTAFLTQTVDVSPLKVTGPVMMPGGTVPEPRGAVWIGVPAGLGGLDAGLTSSLPAVASVPATVHIDAGATSAEFAITAAARSAQATVVLEASALGTTARSNVIVREAYLAPLAPAAQTVAGGASANLTLTLDGPILAARRVFLSASNPAAQVPAFVDIPAGQTTRAISFPTAAVAAGTAITLEAYSVFHTFDDPDIGTVIIKRDLQTATLTLTPPALSLTLSSTSTIGGSSGVTGTVVLPTPAPTGGTTVLLTSGHPAVSVPASVQIPQGSTTSAPFAVTTTAVAANADVTLQATAGALSASRTLQVLAPSLVDFTLAAPTATAGETVGGTVVLNGPAPAAGMPITMTSTDTALATVANVTVPAGQTSTSVTVATLAGVNGTVTLRASLGGSTISRSLTVEAVVGGAVTGTLVDSHTRFPLAGVTVNVQPDIGISAVTDPGGFFRLSGLPAGATTVAAQPPDYQSVSQAVTVTLGQTTSAGTLLAEPNPVTVSGVVVDPDAAGGAQPLAGVEVWALRHGISTTTNAQGEFSFTGLVPGIEILSYRRTGYYAETSTDLLLGPGQQVGNANMDLRVLQPSGAGSVEGRVVDGQGQPIAGASVSVSGAHAATTGADGRYSASVAAGEYGVFAIAVSKTGFERQASTPLRVGAGATPWRLKQDFVLEATGATGTLSATTIEPVSGAAAPGEAILWAPKGRIRLVTPASGTRNAAGPAGPLYEEPLFEHWLRRSLASTGTLAVSGTGTPVVPMGSWAVAGRVLRRATGQPIAGAAVTITPPAGMGGPLNLTTDATGWYRYSGSAAGTHQIGVSASGYDPQSRDLTSPLGAFSRFDFQLEGAGAADEGALAVDTPAPGTTLAGEVTTVTATATFPKPGDHIVRAWVELSEGSVVSQTPAYAPNGTQVTVSLVSDSPRGVTQTITVFVETRYGALLTATRDVTMAHALTAVEIPSPLNAGDIVTGSVVLSGPASAGTVVVLTNPNPALLTVPANVSVPSGADRSDFQVTARATPAGGTVTITGTYGVARTRDVVVNAATLGAITGRVVDARTRFPLEGVTVALQPDAGVSAVTNLDGVFTLATVAPGPATVAVEPPQYQLVTGAVTVAAGVTTDAGTLAAEPEPVTLSGVVVNPDAPGGAQPIAGVEVWAMRHGLTTTTNAQGEFSFTGLVPGVEILTYRKAGYYAETSTDVLMEPGQVIPNANMDLRVLQPSGAGGFEGRVVDATGTPVAGAAVSVSGYQTTTGADGRYSVAATPGEYGKYAVAVSKPGFARQASTPLRVGEGEVSWRLKRDFVLDATDSEGTWSASTIEPMSGAPAAGEVILWAAQGRIRLVTPASGARSVAGPAGPFYEEPLLEHWLRKNLTAAGTLAVRGVGPAVVPAGQWALAGRVLRRASGQPLAGATVTITPPVGGAAILTTDAAGWYRYASALEGAHQVGVSASGYDPQSRDLTSSLGGFSRFDFHLEGAAGADGGSLVIDAPAPFANVPGEVTTVTATATFQRPGDHIVRAWVALSGGSIESQTPVYATNGAQVTVNLTSSSPPGVTQTITLRAETLYGALLTATREVTVVHGLTAVGIPSPLNAGDVVTGSVVLSGPASAGAVVALANPNPALLTVPATVPVPAGADRADFQVTAHPSPAGGTVTITGTYGAAHSQDVVVNAATVGSVTGRLVDARTGFGLSSVLVSIPAGPAATTDLEGAFTLTNVEPGPRQIEADRSGYLPLVRSVTVTAGLTSALGVVNVIPRTADLTIHVQNPSGLPVEGASVLEVNSGQSFLTNAQGDARFPSLPAGAEIFVVHAAGFPPAALDELLIENGTATWIPIQLADLSAGAGSGTVHGVVKNETGLPIPGATVSLAGVAGSDVTTGASGAFSIAVPSGEYGDYVVVARATGYGTMASNRFRAGGTAEPWHLQADFALSPAGSTATVAVTTRDVSVGALAAGSAFVWTTPGRIEIETPPTGLRNAQVPAGTFYRSPADVSTMRRNLVAGSTTPLVVAAEPSAAPPADGWTFLSRVNRMATGEPLAGATVELRPPAGASTFLTSDVDGFVYGSANTSGEHRVFGSGSGYVETESAPFTPSVGSRFVRPEVYLPGDLDSGTLAIVQPAEGAQVAATFTVGVEATLPRTDDQITGILVELSDGAVSSAVATYTNGGRTASIVVAATFGSASQVLTVRARTRYEAELVATRNINTAMLGSVKAVKIASVVLSLPAVTAGAEVKGLVTLTAPAPAGGVRVTLESSRPRVGAVDPLSVVVPAGSTDAGFIVRVPRTVSAPASVTITARANGSRVSQTLAVTPPTVSRPMEPR